MKKKEVGELREKNIEKLLGEVLKKREEIQKSEIALKAGKEKNLKKVNNLKRDLSQLLTIIREKEIAEKEANK